MKYILAIAILIISYYASKASKEAEKSCDRNAKMHSGFKKDTFEHSAMAFEVFSVVLPVLGVIGAILILIYF
jgi:hypothetical protein